MKYYMGIDIGGTMVKACIFNDAGVLMATGSMTTPVCVVGNQHERDMTVLEECIYSVIGKAISRFNHDPSAIACIGCTGHGKGLYLLDQNKKYIRPAIASTDARAYEIVDQWVNSGIEKESKKHTLQPLLACQPAALLRWLKEEEPDHYAKIGYVLSAKDYIRFLLTDEVYAEESDSSGTALLNLSQRCFDRELFRLYGIEELYEKMPPLKCCTDICGFVTQKAQEKTGLLAGTPVCGGMFDIDACALACGDLSSRDISVVTGTWSINQYPSEEFATKERSTKVSLYCDGKRYLLEESSPTSAGNLEWCLSTLFPGMDYKEADSVVSSFKATDCSVVFTPFLYGCIEGTETATFSGLTMDSKKEELLRAVYEGVAFAHRVHIERLQKSDSTKKCLKVTGGAAKSDVWMQLFANITGMEVVTVASKESGALGAAIAASVAVDAYSDLSVASKNMTKPARCFLPNLKEYAAYQDKYECFKKLMKLNTKEGTECTSN